MRSVPEWCGKTDDTPAPSRVRMRVFLAHEGKCFLTGRKITPADHWQIDHRLALCNGGENVESNLVPVLRDAHRIKTRADVGLKAKTDRIRKRHLGLRKRSTFACSRDSAFKKKIDGQVVRR